MLKNPFSNIKATHLSKDEIVNYWVDIHNKEKEEVNFEKVIEPDNPRPIIILGGKGSGKTHILRFYSYESQKVRASQSKDNDLVKQLQLEGYISVLLELGDFQFQRFSGSKLDIDIWSEWYFYYLNLILIEKFLKQILDLENNGLNDFENDKIKEMSSRYFFNEDDTLDSVRTIFIRVCEEHKKIDHAFSRIRTGTDNNIIKDLKPMFDTREHRFLDISHDIIKANSALEKLRILFLLDQFEDLSEEQQKYINTIIRHPKHTETISIRIAGRLYALKDKSTFSDNEKVLGAEATTKKLEGFMGHKEGYEKFSIEMCEKRYKSINNVTLDFNQIQHSFEVQNKEEILQKIKNKYAKSIDRKHIVNFKNNIVKYQNNLKLNTEDIEAVLINISHENPLIEKKNIWLIYQSWSKNENILNKSREIKNSLSNIGKNIHDTETLNHIENDLFFQLCREHSLPYNHCGFENILKYSSANPRNFINILNHVYENAQFYGETMFLENDPVSCKVQDKAIKSASIEFWKDAISDINDSRIAIMAERINSFFKRIRISDKLVEKNLIAFSYRGELSKEASIVLERAVTHSLLDKKEQAKKEKSNSGEMLDIYSVNAMLTVSWDLPISTGGTKQFSASEIEVLCLGNDIEWKKIADKHIEPLNVPFGANKVASLFGDEW